MSALTQAVPATERVMSRLVPQPNGCWHWTGYIDPGGYGRLGYKGNRSVLLQRVVYDLFVGELPGGMVLDHRCHTDDVTCTDSSTCLHRRCGNPEHLEPVTVAENNRRGNNTRKTSCVNGHDYTEANTYRHGGKRYCIACWTDRCGYPPRKANT